MKENYLAPQQFIFENSQMVFMNYYVSLITARYKY